MSSERLERLTAMMRSHVDAGHVAGALSLVYRRGELVHLQTTGYRDLERRLPMTGDALFRIYSMSKPVTSVAVMMLYEAGHFRLSTPVRDILPEFGNLAVYDATAPDGRSPLKRPVTVEDLLTHTSGLTYGQVLGGTTAVDSMYQAAEILWGAPTLEGFVSDLSEIPLLYQPGTAWHYGVSIDVLGRVVEVVSGQAFDEYLDEHLFTPLGMHDTGFEVPPEDADRLAGLYEVGADGVLKPSDSASDYFDVTFFSGGGGLVSSAGDYLRFCRMLLNGGELDGVRILSPKTVDLMMMNHLEVPYTPGFGFGLGGQVVTDVARTARLGSEGTFSWSGAANTYFFIDRKEELIALAWTQLFPYGRYEMHDALRIAVYQALTE